MHRTRAFTVIRAAARLRVLARHSHDDAEAVNGHGDVEAPPPGVDLEQPLLDPQPGPGSVASAEWLASQPPGRSQSAEPARRRAAPSPVVTAWPGGAGFVGGASPPPPSQRSNYSVEGSLRMLSGRSPSSSPLRRRTGAEFPGNAYAIVRQENRRARKAAIGDALASRPVTPLPRHVPWYTRDAVAVRDMLLGSYFNLLLACVPLGFAAYFRGWGGVPVFTLNFLALVPLALLLGDVTEDLALRFGEVVGGLLNATFGNVVEMILSIAALTKGLFTVVAMSLLGSILSNLLLVLGCCFFFGGLRYQTQTFNATANQATSSLLFLSCIGIIIPTAANSLIDGGPSVWILEASRGTAVVLLIIYACYLVFQLHSHNDLFQADDEDESPTLTLVTSVGLLVAITACVAACSEFLTGAIEEFVATTGLSQAFVGMIILPIAGNACEHIVAVMVALKNKMDLALGVAVGSSIQIAIFAIPFAVVVGWVLGKPFSLDFDPFATVALTVSVIHANFVTAGASSHWLMGVELIATYVLIALAFLYR